MKKTLTILCALILALGCISSGAGASNDPLWSEHWDALAELTQKILDRGYMVGAMEYTIFDDEETGGPAVYWPLLDYSYALVTYGGGRDFAIRYVVPEEMWDSAPIDTMFTDFLMVFTGSNERDAANTLKRLKENYDQVELTGEGRYLVPYDGYELAFVYDYIPVVPSIQLWFFSASQSSAQSQGQRQTPYWLWDISQELDYQTYADRVESEQGLRLEVSTQGGYYYLDSPQGVMYDLFGGKGVYSASTDYGGTSISQVSVRMDSLHFINDVVGTRLSGQEKDSLCRRAVAAYQEILGRLEALYGQPTGGVMTLSDGSKLTRYNYPLKGGQLSEEAAAAFLISEGSIHTYFHNIQVGISVSFEYDGNDIGVGFLRPDPQKPADQFESFYGFYGFEHEAGGYRFK